ncbi:SLC13 family permease [Agaricicola taiwanensis]|uniref:SLC13 family permease n=1 Tax=Agaricicola taiwanensis TaxID=591372 RepID=A0A8J2VQ79_9RHOB|nr:SLC13 family permease [Agaricicola taiwanensis]GGE35504.1 SLC13 family permease [Agaricicola taiwanensis]
MTFEQWAAFAILAGSLVLFVWDRIRYDIVALIALMAVIACGLVPMDEAFLGFAHPATITVAAVLIISRGMQNAGIVDVATQVTAPFSGKPIQQLLVQTLMVTFLSAFMNNVGALALMLPVALRNCYRDGYPPAWSLMPLAFGSVLGGLITLIGTPPNIIISGFRERAVGEPFAMFDFAPVGIPVAIAGVIYLAFIGWRLVPKNRRGSSESQNLFDIADYLTEVEVLEGSNVIDMRVQEVEALFENDVTVVSILRGGGSRLAPGGYAKVQQGDVLVLEGAPDSLKKIIDTSGLALSADVEIDTQDLSSDETALVEAIVARRSRLIGSSAGSLRMRTTFGVNMLAVAREGRRLDDRLRDVRFRFGDILLLQGPAQTMTETLSEMGCLPLKERSVGIGRPRRLALASGIFFIAVAALVADLVPAHIGFTAAALALVLTNIVAPDEAYEAIDWPVIILLGAFGPVGTAMEATGSAELVAGWITAATGGLAPVWTLTLLMVVTMWLSDILNNNATAFIMAPIALGIAQGLGVNPDPFLMAIAIGASCAFLTPIGHQSSTLVWEPGGYKFLDFTIVGLPLEAICVAVSVPLILLFWPF